MKVLQIETNLHAINKHTFPKLKSKKSGKHGNKKDYRRRYTIKIANTKPTACIEPTRTISAYQ